MWRDISATQVHQSLNPYQQYPPPPSATLQHGASNKYTTAPHGGSGGGGGPSGPGARSSYSLPHPGHAQSNSRWQKPSDRERDLQHQQQLAVSARNLVLQPSSFLYGSSSGSQQDLSTQGGVRGGGQPQSSGMAARQRPASMYETPSMGYAGAPNGARKAAHAPAPPAPGKVGSGVRRKNSAELVSVLRAHGRHEPARNV